MPDYNVLENFKNGYYSVTDPDGETILIRTGKLDYSAGDVISGELGQDICGIPRLADNATTQNRNQLHSQEHLLTTGRDWAEDYWARKQEELEEANVVVTEPADP